MTTQANYFKIGLFTLAATALLVVVIVVLGAGAFLKDRAVIETYLDESIQGIELGSPVKYRGVHVGTVHSIMFTYNVYETEKPFGERRGYVLLRMAVSPRVIERAKPHGFRRTLADLVEQGLHVRLRPQGLTGLAYVEMDYVPPGRYKELSFDWRPQYPYVPSAPSVTASLEEAVFSITETLERLEEADLGQIATDVGELVDAVGQLLAEARTSPLHEQAVGLLNEARETNARLRQVLDKPEIDSLVDGAAGAASALHEIAEDSRRDVREIVSDLRRVSADLKASTASLPAAIEDLTTAMARLNALISRQQRQIASTIENLEAASGHVRELADEARRYPARIFFGEPPPPSEPTE